MCSYGPPLSFRIAHPFRKTRVGQEFSFQSNHRFAFEQRRIAWLRSPLNRFDSAVASGVDAMFQPNLATVLLRLLSTVLLHLLATVCFGLSTLEEFDLFVPPGGFEIQSLCQSSSCGYSKSVKVPEEQPIYYLTASRKHSS